MKKLEKTASELRDQLEDEQYFSVRSQDIYRSGIHNQTGVEI